MRLMQDAWTTELRESVAPLRSDVRRLTTEIERLHATLDRTVAALATVERSADQTRLVLRLNQRQHADVARLPQTLDADRVRAFVRHAIERSTLHDDPCPYALVEPLLPADVYKTVLRAIPPVAFFGARDPIKQNLRIPVEFAPALTETVWRFVDEFSRAFGKRIETMGSRASGLHRSL